MLHTLPLGGYTFGYMSLLTSQELGVAWHLQSHIFNILVMGTLDGSVLGEGDRAESERAPGPLKPG